MNIDSFPLLLAANKYRLIDVDLPPLFNLPAGLLIVPGLIVLSFVLGYLLANALRLRDYGWKVGLILSTLLVSTFVVLFGEFKLGVDLKGGVILVYEVDEEQTASLNPQGRADQWEMSQLLSVLTRRLNPEGLKEIVVRPFGPKQVEIVVPETDPREVEDIKERIRTGGVLQFMIVAGEKDSDLLELARQQAALQSEERLKREVVDENGRRVGYWAQLGREDGDPETAPFRSPDVIATGFLRDHRTGEVLELTERQRMEFANSDLAFKAYLAQRGTRDVDVLMVYDPDFDIRGEDLAYAAPDRDESLRPSIRFGMKGEGTFKMGYVTQNNLQRKLAIIFDNVLLSAPVIQSKISDSGQISGNFTQDKVDFIVGILRSGSMPVVMKKFPISENQIGAILGMDTIIKGSYSIGISLLLVLGFTLAYYRFAGFVACCALVLNLLLTLAIMIMLQAPLTLPGLAGLVLTVGMSVDSNVLIFERIREELDRGAALRMAIRNGFDRAIVTIIDSNLTTLLTAFVLYFIGTDQVKGFGITLILGILTSMYTAIFCARTVFEMGERSRWLKHLRMTRFLTNPNVDWVKWFKPATIASCVLISLGLVATVARGRGLFDIDLAGGTSVTFLLKEPMPVAEVRSRLDKTLLPLEDPETKTRVQYTTYELALTGESQRPQTVYKVDSSLGDVEMLKQKVREALRAHDGSDLLKTFRMEIQGVTEAPLEPPPTRPTLSAPGAGTKAAPGEPAQPPPASAPAPTNQAEPAKSEPAKSEPANTEPAKSEPEKADSEKAEPTKAEPAKAAEPAKSELEKSDPATSEPEKTEPAKNETSPPETSASAPPPGGCDDELFVFQENEAKSAAADTTKSEPAAPAPAATAAPQAADAAKKSADASQAEAPPASAAGAELGQAPAESGAEKAAASPPAGPAIGAAPAATDTAPAAPAGLPAVKSTVKLSFPGSAMSGDALRDRIKASSRAVINQDIEVLVENPNWDGRDNSLFEEWSATLLRVNREQAEKIVNHLQSQLQNEVIWQTSSKFGGQVSADMRYKAVTAIVISLLGIVAYMWFRFQKAVWGIAAVVALAHDTLVMLGGIAASYWLADALGFMGVEQFKISLPVIAAFLTLIGFSVNDTIVIFDRIREVRGKSPTLTPKMLNDSVNQTMSRTILTSGTVFIVVVILYFFGGPGIHAFAFSLVIGVISGTYSTVYIASPLLLWLFERGNPQPTGKLERREVSKSVA